MMRTVLGSAIGGLVAGAVALGAASQMRSTPAPEFGADPNSGYAMPVANTGMLSQGGVVQCQPYQEPVLQRGFVNGREVAAVTCAMRTEPPAYYPARTAYADDVVSMPRARTVSRPVSRERVTYASPDVRAESGRSWKKTAMIIGGSTGGGAGIGALVGGKKGALIGAAIGGGAATIYESTKR